MRNLFIRFLNFIGISGLLFAKKLKKPRPYACCNVRTNMKIQWPRKDIVIETCKVCERRHFRLKLENIQSKLTMT